MRHQRQAGLVPVPHVAPAVHQVHRGHAGGCRAPGGAVQGDWGSGVKVLFLDIDGVLNSMRTCVAYGSYPHSLGETNGFDQVAIRMIRGMCAEGDIKVVLSSAWRLSHDFKDVGKAFDLPIIDRTPSMLGPRGQEIQAWLTGHPEVERFAIVDDDSDMLDVQAPFFVKTDGFEGLTWAAFLKLCEVFGVDPYAGAPRALDWRNGSGQSLFWGDA